MPVRSNLVWGLLWGTLLASVFSALLAIAVLFRIIVRYVSPGLAPSPVGELPLVALIMGFFIGGVAAGVTFSLLWPLVERTTGAWLVGMLAAIPFFLAIRIAVKGFSDWTDGDLVRLAAVSAAWAIGTAGLYAVGFYRR